MRQEPGRSLSKGVLELELRGKTPLLRIFLIVILIVLPIVGISDLIVGDYVSGAGELALFAAVLVSLLLLRSGRYRIASRIAAFVFYAGTTFLALNTPASEPIVVFKLITYTSAALAFSSFFLVDAGVPVLLAGLNGLGAILYIVIGFSGSLKLGGVVNESLVALIFSSLISFLIIAPMRMSRGISGDLVEERGRSDERTALLEAAAARSETNLGAIGELSGKVADIREAADAALEAVSRIELRLHELDSAADEATSEAGSIGNRVSDLNRHIQTEASAQEESAASVNQMVASLSSVADSARKRREGLQGLRGTAEEGQSRLAALFDAIRRMEGSVGSIREMIAVINKIASSTNLLAMNAAIEAAHAGDAGRGFAVVADEIRGLAEGSAKNAKDIGVKLKEIVAAITDAAGEGSRTSESFSGVKREIDQAISSFDEIKVAMQELSEGGRQILESVRALNESSQGLREGGAAIASAQGKLVELQGKTKAGVGAALADAKAVEKRSRGLISASAAVSAVAEESARAASELHDSMASVKAPERL
jgi:methyl-accepting chemotaxis protein